jgi:regulator of protease activity HflC (stomatin/prohibitin superfamily)
MEYLVLSIALIVLAGILLKICVRRITIFEYEKGLKYTRGKFSALLAPGVYWYIPFFVSIPKIDVRPRFVSILGQELLSSDGVTLRVSLAANFEIADPNVAVNNVQNFQEALYLELQLALREIIGSVDIDTLRKLVQ